MILHIEFCLDEIECEIDAPENGDRPDGGRNELHRHIAEMRALLVGWKAEVAAEPEQSVERKATIEDDLTLIRGIDDTVVARLTTKGVTRFQTIADWRAADMAALSDDHEFVQRISRENWIEQAAVLATGKLTHFAERKKPGQFANVVSYVSTDSAILRAVDVALTATVTDVPVGEQCSAVIQEPAIRVASIAEATPTANVVPFPVVRRHRARNFLIEVAASLLIIASVGVVKTGNLPAFAAVAGTELLP